MSLIATRLQKFRAAAPLDKWETRASRYGALDLFKVQTDDEMGIISSDLAQKAIASVGSNLEVPAFNKNAGVQVLNQTIPVLIEGVENTSRLIPITFQHYYFSFLVHPALHMNNELGMQADFNKKLRDRTLKLMGMLNDAALAKLDAMKTKVLADNLGGRYTFANDAVTAPLAEQEAAVGDIGVLQAGNDYFDRQHVLANGSMESLVRNKLMEKGEFNRENKTYQYADKTWHFTNNLDNAADRKATSYAVQRGSVGMLQQFARDCVLGNRTHKHLWDIETLPILNMPFGVYQYEDSVDGSGLAGAASADMTATKAESYAFHSAIAFIGTDQSDPTTNATPVLKLDIATT